jgi:hypothetical protein
VTLEDGFHDLSVFAIGQSGRLLVPAQIYLLQVGAALEH